MVKDRVWSQINSSGIWKYFLLLFKVENYVSSQVDTYGVPVFAPDYSTTVFAASLCTEVKDLPQQSKVKGSILASVIGSKRENDKKHFNFKG